MSQQASFYYHIDTDGNYWFPLFPTEEEAIAFSGLSVDDGGFGQNDPSAHPHPEFDGNTWYMPNPMASDINELGSLHGEPSSDALLEILDGAQNITSFDAGNINDDLSDDIVDSTPGEGSGNISDGEEDDEHSTLDEGTAGTQGNFYQLQPGETMGFASLGSTALKSNTSDNQLLMGSAEGDFIYSWAGDNNVLFGQDGEDVFQVRSDATQAITLNAGDIPEIIAVSGVSTHSFAADLWA